uniref:NADH-ubiquinone oxidoreductase chain 2 n=1 Tax=Russelliana solanicola TaxID=2008469 RepID=A0A344A2R0_9HEMI|nr:NADH dehydrogenase subunit 2 [Russelliana solanicola]AWU49051.1 NADH dehydrogenase subunit 2 [Russelliana solanicola]
MKNYNYIVLPLYMMSIIFTLSSPSWMMIWIGMEMNLLTFIFIIMQASTMFSMESSMKYFLIQASGSLIFLLSLSTNMIFYDEMFKINCLVPPLALILKSGMAPLHTWTPEIISKFNLKGLFLFTTLQKIIPMVILFSSWAPLISWILMFNILMGSIGGISQSSFSKMIIFSSINNSGWMLLALSQSYFTFQVYFMVYTLMTFMLIYFMKSTQIKWIIQVKSIKAFQKSIFIILILSMSGLPPFLGFIPKWMVLMKLMNLYPLTVLLGIFFSILTMFFYIKSSICMMMVTISSVKPTFNYKNSYWSIFMSLHLLSPFLYFLL